MKSEPDAFLLQAKMLTLYTNAVAAVQAAGKSERFYRSPIQMLQQRQAMQKNCPGPAVGRIACTAADRKGTGFSRAIRGKKREHLQPLRYV
jgi:DUF1365 family protein